MSWRIAHRWECGHIEQIKVARGYQSVLPLLDEDSKQLTTLKAVKKSWQGSFIETAQDDVIKVREGYFVVKLNAGRGVTPSFQKLEDPRPHCSLRRRVS